MAQDPWAGFADAPPFPAAVPPGQAPQVDPYAGLGTVVPAPQQMPWSNDPIVRAASAQPWNNDPIVKPAAGGDPYAGLGTPVPQGADPFAGFADAPPLPATTNGAPTGGVDLSKMSDAQLQAVLDGRKAAAARSGGQPSPLTIKGSPQNAGEALDMVEGTGSAAYDTGPAEGGATYGDRLRNMGGMVVAGLDGIANSVPFTDRLAALAAAGTGIGGKFGDYSGNLAQLRGEEGAAMDAHPGAALAGSIAGGAALPIGAVGDVLQGATLAGKVAAGAKAGLSIGALQGASSSPDLRNVAQTAASTGTGAIAGGVIGGAVPAIGSAAGAGFRALAGRSVQEVPGVPATARQMVVQALRNDDPAAVMAKLRQYGPDATLSDLGPSLQGIAMGQAVKDGPGASIILNNLAARQGGTSDRVLADVGQAVGPAQNADALGRSIADVGQAASAPLYDRAAAAGVADPAELAQRPAVASALRDAATAAANRGTPFPSITLDAAGNPVGSDAALQAYNAGTRPAVTDALARLMGTDANAAGPAAATDSLTAQRSAAADPLYEAYRSMNVPMTPELADVLNRPSVQSAIPAAERKAQDQGRTIFAQRGAGFDRDPLGSGVTPEMPADLPEIPPHTGDQAPSRPAPVGVPRPVDLHSFIRSLGGMQDPGGDLASMGLHSIIARPGQGLGPDAVRQVAAEAGYLGGDTNAAMRNTTIGDLHNALENGDRTFSVHDEDAVHAWAARDAAMQDYQQGGAARGEVGRDAGMRPTPPGLPFGGPDAPTGPAARAPQLTPEGLDYLKRTLGDKIDTAQRAGNRDDARIYTGLQQQLLGAIERHPDSSIADAYGAARQAYAGPSREIDALNSGRAAFADNVTPEQVQREYAALSTDGERQRYRQGMFSAGSEKLSKGGDASNFVRTVSGNQALRDKFAAVAPHQEALDVFNGHIARAQQQFTEAQQPTPEAWRQTLAGLDARVAKGEPGIAEARDALAAHLSSNPDFARARGIEQEYGGLQNALTAGRTALRGGPNAVHPDDYAAAFDALTAPGQAAQRAGLGDSIYRKLGDTRNDLTAINDVIKGPNDRSRSIIASTFGQAAADHLAGSAKREAAFAKNYDDVLRGSMTARRQAMQKAQADAEVEPYQIHGVHDLTWEGAALTGAAKLVNPLLRLFQQPVDNTARDIALSRIVSTPGEARNAMLARLLRTQNAEDANAAMAAPVERGVTMAGAVTPAVLAAALRGRQQPSR